MSYGFRPFTADDLPLARRWLETPHCREWWGGPDEEEAGLRDDLNDPRMDQWIATLDGRPFGYIQDYDPLAWGGHHFGFLPAGARGIDQFIGEPEMLGRGHGSAMVRLHTDALFARGAPAVGIDPDPANARAIRAYEKAGFVRVGEQDTEWGYCLLMTKHRPE